MKLSTKSRYGVRAIFDIAYYSGGLPTQVKEISKRQEVTPRYLEQIFQKLKRAGIVKSIRGPKGGYFLARKADKITVGDVVRATEGSIDPVFCVRAPRGRKRCSREGHCVTQVIWRETGQRMGEYLDSVTVDKLCQMAKELGFERQLDHRFMYFI